MTVSKDKFSYEFNLSSKKYRVYECSNSHGYITITIIATIKSNSCRQHVFSTNHDERKILPR